MDLAAILASNTDLTDEDVAAARELVTPRPASAAGASDGGSEVAARPDYADSGADEEAYPLSPRLATLLGFVPVYAGTCTSRQREVTLTDATTTTTTTTTTTGAVAVAATDTTDPLRHRHHDPSRPTARSS